MSRPCKCRRIGFNPEATQFRPCGIPVRSLEEVSLTMDELEAIRLADLEGSYQEDAAARMEISRQTFGNILGSARKKVADALVNAKALRIHGGVCNLDRGGIHRCADCRHEWFGQAGPGTEGRCPRCQGYPIQNIQQEIDSRRKETGGKGSRKRRRESR